MTILTKTAEVGCDEQGNTHVNQYVLLKTLGKGSYGTVRLCVDKRTQACYACKVVAKHLVKKKNRLLRPEERYDVHREVDVLAPLQHPNVIALVEVVDDPNEDEMYLVFEYVEGGSLTAADATFDPFPLDRCRAYFGDLVRAVEYIHAQGVVHRDIKPENCLVTEDQQIKLADFGSALKLANREQIRSTVGSPAFFAPEMLAGTPYNAFGADVWAMGVSLFAFVFGRYPYMAETSMEVFDMIRDDPVEIPLCSDKDLVDLLRRLFDKNPATRITIADIWKHPWLTARDPPEAELIDKVEQLAVEPRQERSDSLMSLFSDINARLASMQTAMTARNDKFQTLEEKLRSCESELQARGERFEQLKRRLDDLNTTNA